jgi:hypothetical protein
MDMNRFLKIFQSVRVKHKSAVGQQPKLQTLACCLVAVVLTTIVVLVTEDITPIGRKHLIS